MRFSTVGICDGVQWYSAVAGWSITSDESVDTMMELADTMDDIMSLT